MVKAHEQTLTIEQVHIDDLRPDPANPRRIGERELEALTRSLKEFGFVQPVLVRRSDNVVIGGHQRLIAARRLGWKTVPVIFLDLAPEQARLLNLALNKISGQWDTELLARMLADLKPVEDIDLSLSGFSEEELGKLLKSLEVREKRGRVEAFDLDAALEAARAAPVAQRGDLWRLGDHRLLCGDSTDEGDVKRLMAGEQAKLMATDPPYLVDYVGGSHPSRGNKGRKSKDKHWDDYHDPVAAVDFFVKFLQVALPHLAPHSAIYQWHANTRQALVEQAWRQCGLLVHQVVIWVKARGVLTHSHYMWRHEPCLYGWPEGHMPRLKPPSNESTVWEVDHFGEQMGIHPTQKPLELFERPIAYHTEPNDICYEPFLGSGTQLIACERLGRRCYAVELERSYVDVAVARWEAFSGLKAVKVE
jgi:DNA modification methylase